MGASLLILANKQDLHGAASKEEIAQVSSLPNPIRLKAGH